jgi:predicted ATP-grasp superfamily ATP-dependent carboligase
VVTATGPRPVLIFGAHLAALGVLRVLARHGIPAFVADQTTNVIVRSRWYRPAERTLAETSDPAVLADYLRSLALPGAVLIACSDRWALAVAGLPADLRERFPASIAPHASIEQFVDKDRFRALVDRLDIPRPRTLPVREPADLDLASDADLAVSFLKPTESQAHNRRFRTKGFFVESREEAAQLVEQARAAGITFMLQEWIPGDMSKTVIIDGFVDRHGEVRAMLARRRVRMDPPRLANTSSDVTIPLEEVAACLPAVRTLLQATAYRGIFMIEFKYDERDGLFKIIELNARPFWLIGHIERAGVDLPWLSYLDAQRLDVPTSGAYQVGRYGMYEILDAAAIGRAIRSRRRPEGAVVKPWLVGDKALFWWSDPMPALGGLGQSVRRKLGRVTSRPGRRTGTNLDAVTTADAAEIAETANRAFSAR